MSLDSLVITESQNHTYCRELSSERTKMLLWACGTHQGCKRTDMNTRLFLQQKKVPGCSWSVVKGNGLGTPWGTAERAVLMGAT